MKIILMGPPGSGKGTQASFLASITQVNSVSSGDLFRDNLSRDTELGRLAKTYMDQGKYVPDDVTIGMVMSWIEAPENREGFVLDGFPRTPQQAEALDDRLGVIGGVDKVILFNVPELELIKRLAGRMLCRKCQTPYHKEFSPPLCPGFCDICDGELFQREDDSEAVVKERLSVYKEETNPVIERYREFGNLVEIDGSLSIEAVEQSLREALG
ncbi:adenylate kinase [Chloroflexi bacterium]|nr:adenylate kinase [Chloroflexota bacterium]